MHGTLLLLLLKYNINNRTSSRNPQAIQGYIDSMFIFLHSTYMAAQIIQSFLYGRLAKYVPFDLLDHCGYLLIFSLKSLKIFPPIIFVCLQIRLMCFIYRSVEINVFLSYLILHNRSVCKSNRPLTM